MLKVERPIMTLFPIGVPGECPMKKADIISVKKAEDLPDLELKIRSSNNQTPEAVACSGGTCPVKEHCKIFVRPLPSPLAGF